MSAAMSSRPTEPASSNLDRIIGERREKASALRAGGSDPFRNDIGPAISIAEVRAKYAATKPEAPPPRDPNAPKPPKDADARITPIDGTPLRVAGRVMVKR